MRGLYGVPGPDRGLHPMRRLRHPLPATDHDHGGRLRRPLYLGLEQCRRVATNGRQLYGQLHVQPAYTKWECVWTEQPPTNAVPSPRDHDRHEYHSHDRLWSAYLPELLQHHDHDRHEHYHHHTSMRYG